MWKDEDSFKRDLNTRVAEIVEGMDSLEDFPDMDLSATRDRAFQFKTVVRLADLCETIPMLLRDMNTGELVTGGFSSYLNGSIFSDIYSAYIKPVFHRRMEESGLSLKVVQEHLEFTPAVVKKYLYRSQPSVHRAAMLAFVFGLEFYYFAPRHEFTYVENEGEFVDALVEDDVDVALVKSIVAERITHLHDIEDLSSFDAATILNVARVHNLRIQIPRTSDSALRQIAAMMYDRKGLSFEQYADLFSDVSREKVRRYVTIRQLRPLFDEGLQARRAQNREDRLEALRNPHPEKQELVQLLHNHADELLGVADNYTRKTGQVIQTKNFAKSAKQILGVIADFYECRARGESLTLHKLGKPYDVRYDAVSRILEAIGEDAIEITRERTITPPGERRTISRAFDLPVRAKDVEHFTGVHSFSVRSLWNLRGKKKAFKPLLRLWGIPYKPRNVSDVLMAKDAGFAVEEISEYVGVSIRYVKKVLGHEAYMRQQLTSLMQKLYDKRHTKPYVKLQGIPLAMRK